MKEYYEPVFVGCGRGKRFWTEYRLDIAAARLPLEPFEAIMFEKVYVALTGLRCGVQGMQGALLRTGRVRRVLIRAGPRPKRKYSYEVVSAASEQDIREARQLMGLGGSQ